MNSFLEARRLCAVNVAEMPTPCGDRLTVSGTKSLPPSFCKPGGFLRRNRVIRSLQEQAVLAERMPDGGAAYWSWLSLESSDNFGGWSTASSSENPSLNGPYVLGSGRPLPAPLHGSAKIPGFAGFPHAGAGVILAISFALASCLAFSKTGLTFQDLTSEQQSHIFRTPASTKIKEEKLQKSMQIKERDHLRADTCTKSTGSKSIKSAVPGLVSRLWISSCKEPMHDQALSMLQTLEIAEASCQPVDLCTRREYARWLVLASNVLSRKPSETIFPAIYVEGNTSLAFDDILPEDRDFPYIQGMAEAGLIASKLDFNESNSFDSIASEHNQNKDNALFLPDSFVSRQEVVSWKVALEHPFGWRFEEKVAEWTSWYFDIENVPTAARSGVLMDMYAGEKSIAASAFGYTRRFQPERPVTYGQAALAIVSGEMAEAVAEEIATLQEENLKNEVIMKELMSEAHALKEQDAEFKQVLAELREKTIENEKMAEATILEANILKDKRWNETLLFERELAAIDLEKIFLSRIRDSLLDRMDALSAEETNLQSDKKRLVELKVNAGKKKQYFLQRGCKAKAEMRAVTFARLWTEDQAKRALSYTKMLAQSKKYWGKKEIDECYVETGKEAEGSPVRSTLQNREGAEGEGLTSVRKFDKQFRDVAKQKTMELLREFREKSREMQPILSIVPEKVQGLRMHGLQRFRLLFSKYAGI